MQYKLSKDVNMVYSIALIHVEDEIYELLYLFMDNFIHVFKIITKKGTKVVLS